MDSTDTVGELITLQEIDIEILKIHRELEELEEEIETLEGAVGTHATRAEGLRAKLEEAEERVRKFQRSVQAGRATLKRLETRSGEVTNMQQHFAVRSETDTARRNLRLAEDDALSAMQDVENVGGQLGVVESELTQARATLATRQAEVIEIRQRLEADLESHTDTRRTHEGRLDRSALRLYRSVSGGRSTSALAALTQDGCCGHCYTAVPKQRQADIRAGRSLAVCEGCGVILYADDSHD